MDSGIEATGALVRVKVNWQKGSSNNSKGVSFPVCHYISLTLLVCDELDVYF